MATRVQLRRGPAAQWTAANPILAAGEPAMETDTGKLKVGDGTTAWASLPYILDEADLADSATLRAAYAPARPTIFGDPTSEPDGSPAALTSGQTVSVFGNAPLARSGGKYAHTPFAGANSSAYLQVADAGGRVNWIGCEAEWPAGSTGGSVALVAPLVPWANGSLTAAGIHAVFRGNGTWDVGYWNGNAVEKYTDRASPTSWNDGLPKRFDINLDTDAGTADIRLPDGSTYRVTDPRIATHTAATAIWELYEFDGTTATPAKLRAVWAGTKPATDRVPTATVSPYELTKALGSRPTKATTNAVRWYESTTPATIAATTSFTDVTGFPTLTFTVPDSGKVLIEVVGYLAMTAGSKVLWQVADNSTGTALATQTVVNQSFSGNLTMRALLQSGLTPGSVRTVKLQHLATVAGTTAMRSDPANGYVATMTATPVL